MKASSGTGDWVLRGLLWALLGGWLGSWGLFVLVIARVAFRVLPSAEVAGQLVSPTLAALHLYGAVAGALLAGLARVLGRGSLLFWLPLALAAACLVSEFGVTPQLAALREATFGPDGNADAAARYRQLHGLSMAIFSAVWLGTFVLIGLHSRRDAPQASDSA